MYTTTDDLLHDSHFVKLAAILLRPRTPQWQEAHPDFPLEALWGSLAAATPLDGDWDGEAVEGALLALLDAIAVAEAPGDTWRYRPENIVWLRKVLASEQRVVVVTLLKAYAKLPAELLTAEELADLTGTTVSHWRHMARGRYNMKVASFKKGGQWFFLRPYLVAARLIPPEEGGGNST